MVMKMEKSSPNQKYRNRKNKNHIFAFDADVDALQAKILDALAYHLAVLDTHGNILHVNAAWQRFAEQNGADPQTRLGRGLNYLEACRKALGEADPGVEAALAGIRDVLAGEQEIFRIEYPCHSPTEKRWFLMIATRLHGAHQGAVITHLNITDRVTAERALHHSQQETEDLMERMQRVVEFMPVMLVAVDAAAVPLLWNREAERITGYSENEMVGNARALEVLYPEVKYRKKVWQEWQRTWGDLRGFETTIVCKDRSTRRIAWYSVSQQAPVPGWDTWSIGLDITRRAEAEEKLQEMYRQLEQRVEARTVELDQANRELRDTNRRLTVEMDERRRAEMALRESDKLAATGRLAGRIAHEINNPLAGIQNAFLLIQTAIPPEHPYAAYVPRAQKEIERIAGIIKQMYALFRPPRKTLIVFPLEEVIEDILLLLQAEAREKQVTLRQATPDRPTLIRQDEDMLRQVLYNLIRNAIDASPEGGEIGVATQIETGRVVIAISDQGPGISDQIAPLVFEPFFTTKTEFAQAGLGQGLSISKTLIESLHGDISFETTLGQGTTFFVRLPLPETKELLDESTRKDSAG